MADFLSATQTYLLNGLGINDVYALRIPRSVIETMPKQVVLVVGVGGAQTLHNGYNPVGDYRVDIRCLGPDRDQGFQDAMNLWRQIHGLLKNDLKQQVVDGILLYWAKPAGGPVSMIDNATDWPMINSTWQIFSEDAE